MSFVNARDLPFAEDRIAVAMQRTQSGHHLGLIFTTKKEGTQLLHLKFHKDMSVEAFPDPMGPCWIAAFVDIPPAASKALISIVRSVAAKKIPVPFGLNFLAAKGSINAKGGYAAPKGSDGLTCATYVVEIFRGASIALVDETTWEANEENKKWEESICQVLARKADAAHVAAVRQNINGLRIRPEEVAAVAQKPAKRPVPYDVAVAGALVVVAHLNRICPPTLLVHARAT